MHVAESLPLPDWSSEPDQADDHTLVIAAQSGSEMAFRELCRRNSGRVFRSISRITRDHADAEDALQDSLMRAFLHIHQFDRRSSFSTWLTRIGINSALMILRKKRRTHELSFDFTDSDEKERRKWDKADVAANPEEHCLSNEMTRAINQAVGNLPGNLRVVTELRLVQNLALHEIAAMLNISIAAAKSRLFRARRQIVVSLRGNIPAPQNRRDLDDRTTKQFSTAQRYKHGPRTPESSMRLSVL